jgi:hypothetical protein
MADAIAQPTAWMYCVARLPEIEKKPLAALVGQQLADHVDQRVVARDQQALLAVGGEAHVAVLQRQHVSGGDGLLAQALHVERHLLLALAYQHAGVEDAGLHHRAQALALELGRHLRRPRADGVALLVEHAHQLEGQVVGGAGIGVHRGAADLAGGREMKVGEVGRATRSPRGLRDVQTQGVVLGHRPMLRTRGGGLQRCSSRIGRRVVGVPRGGRAGRTHVGSPRARRCRTGYPNRAARPMVETSIP